jgi:hypothetical protein
MARGARLTIATLAVCLLSTTFTRGEQREKLEWLRQQVARLQSRIDRMPAYQRRRLGAVLDLLQLLRQRSQLDAGLPGGQGAGAMALSPAGSASTPDSGSAPKTSSALTAGRVSDPRADAATSFLAGFTQSTTSTAWCGSSVIVAFSDTGSILPSFLAGGGTTFSGYSRSTDQGRTFRDMGFVPVSNRDALLVGRPVAACTDARTFYYASVLVDVGTSASGPSVSKSTDGGVTFGEPVKAVVKEFDHSIDDVWMAADPTNHRRLFLTYTDFDFSGSVCEPDPIGLPRLAIEIVRSDDGGATWGPPVPIARACEREDREQGARVAVDDRGRVYVAWEHNGNFGFTSEIRLRRSDDGGLSFGPAVVVVQAVPVGQRGFPPGLRFLQGFIRGNGFPSLAVDRSRGPRKGDLYVSWNDGGFVSIPDDIADAGSYAFSDILIVRSTDGGATFEAPTRVNRGSSTELTDQYMPALAVDKTGTVGVCYYDRRRDKTNFFIDRRCARSQDGGRHWASTRITERPFLPTTLQDFAVAFGDQGDYDTLTGDFLQGSAGLLGAYADNALGNQDVKSNRLSADAPRR